ncbi:MAG: 5'-nucleotidase, lipoprotein e(P4) family [Planctomycetes bacterium]|nr:5'-nucleotidase, lipoprotein e(P4) family [Planctomycetota bacterium]
MAKTLILLGCCTLLAACETAPPPAKVGDATGALNAVAWAQTAAEHDAVCRQVFAAATRRVAELAGALDGAQRGAVIVDVDETVLDNSPHMARLVLDQQTFHAATWAAWCTEAKAAPIPGALDFARFCHERNVTVFYVTNRDRVLEEATRRNLREQGFPLADRDGIDVVLCLGEVDGKSGKDARRAQVAKHFTVLVLVGDDLGDFLEPRPSVAERRRQLEEHAHHLGTRWFVLPNPMYGSWERAARAGNPDAFQGKMRALDPRR